jgi:hypothetical protein
VPQPNFRFWKAQFAGKQCVQSRLVISHCLTAPQSPHIQVTGWVSSTLGYYRFSKEDWVSFGGRRTLKNFVLKCAHSKIFWRGVKYFGTNFLCVYILEVGVARGATMVGAERENFETFKSLDRRKWHFQSLVWPSASCRAQKESR